MKQTKTIALISISGFILFLVIVFTLHFLRPDKNMLTCYISEYAVGNYSWLLKISYYVLATSTALMLTGLLLNIDASKTSIITLGIFSFGILLASIFPTDVPVLPPTSIGLIHGIAALIALISLGITMIAWGFVFKKKENWKSFVKPSTYFGVLSLVLFIIHFASPLPIRGLTQRFLLVWDISWLLLVSNKLYRNSLLPEPQLIG